MQKVTISADDGDKLVAKVGRVRLEGLLHGLAREVCVSAIQIFEKRDLAVTGKIDILHAICNELH